VNKTPTTTTAPANTTAYVQIPQLKQQTSTSSTSTTDSKHSIAEERGQTPKDPDPTGLEGFFKGLTKRPFGQILVGVVAWIGLCTGLGAALMAAGNGIFKASHDVYYQFGLAALIGAVGGLICGAATAVVALAASFASKVRIFQLVECVALGASFGAVSGLVGNAALKSRQNDGVKLLYLTSAGAGSIGGIGLGTVAAIVVGLLFSKSKPAS